MSKAEGNFATAQRELRARRSPSYDAACFHAQQCVEKYLKACLQKANIPIPRTHDLAVLLNALLAIDPALSALLPAMRLLSVFAVEVRYPITSADRAMASDAVTQCEQIRQALRQHLGLNP